LRSRDFLKVARKLVARAPQPRLASGSPEANQARDSIRRRHAGRLAGGDNSPKGVHRVHLLSLENFANALNSPALPLPAFATALATWQVLSPILRFDLPVPCPLCL
jgi:hypothetical protein